MAEPLIVKEYESITANSAGCKAFEELKTFASYEQNWQFLRIAKGGRELKAQNYVGVIQTKSGVVVEILPKINDVNDDDGSVKTPQKYYVL